MVRKTETCWLWTGAVDPCGYGRFRAHVLVSAHRWAYEQFVGRIPDGLELDHACRVRTCVNPAHLEPVTHAENMRRSGPFTPNANKTHCARGHAFTPENTYEYKTRRNCRTCNRQNVAAARARRGGDVQC